ncbi:GWxTD domain-containing protein [Acidobacteriota bacterium]
MRKKLLFCILIGCFALNMAYAKDRTSLSARQKRKIYRTLNYEYKRWYDMISHIASDQEKNVFLALTNDKDRNIFINTFWMMRDPTPGTPLNEQKKEIEERFAYVNREFKKGSSKPGWMTDMGKFYMILGKPNNIDRFDNQRGLYPAQV